MGELRGAALVTTVRELRMQRRGRDEPGRLRATMLCEVRTMLGRAYEGRR